MITKGEREGGRINQEFGNKIYTLPQIKGFPVGLYSKESTCNEGDLSQILGLGRSPGERNGNPLQYSWLENSMDRGAWWVTVCGMVKSSMTITHTHTHTPYIKQVNNKVLLYNIGSYTHSLVMAYNGREYKKRMYVFLCVYMYN